MLQLYAKSDLKDIYLLQREGVSSFKHLSNFASVIYYTCWKFSPILLKVKFLFIQVSKTHFLTGPIVFDWVCLKTIPFKYRSKKDTLKYYYTINTKSLYDLGCLITYIKYIFDYNFWWYLSDYYVLSTYRNIQLLRLPSFRWTTMYVKKLSYYNLCQYKQAETFQRSNWDWSECRALLFFLNLAKQVFRNRKIINYHRR